MTLSADADDGDDGAPRVPAARLERDEEWDGTATLGRGWLVGSVDDVPMLAE